jgi:hypothetical protein
MRHLDRMHVAELVRREAPPHASRGGHPSQLLAHSGLLPMPTGGRAVHDAQQRPDG